MNTPEHDHSGHHHPNRHVIGVAGASPPGKAVDPVCGMTVTIEGAKNKTVHEGHPYYFCSARCLGKFEAGPLQYLNPAEDKAPPTAVEKKAIFTCPMHPEIKQVGPGSCPKCGMALEPLDVTADAGPNHELIDMTRRFWIGLALTLPVFVLEMGEHLHLFGHMQASVWIQFALATPVVLWAGWPVFVRAWASVVNRSLNMFSLIALGTGAAYIYSVVALLAPGLFPAGFRGMGGAVAVYFEAAAVITVLVLLGQMLELRARERTGDAIRACSISLPRPRGGSRPEARMRKWLSTPSRSATSCAYGRARACLSMAS